MCVEMKGDNLVFYFLPRLNLMRLEWQLYVFAVEPKKAEQPKYKYTYFRKEDRKVHQECRDVFEIL